MFAGLDFVSSWVRDRVLVLACRRENANMVQFVRSAIGIGPLGTLRGSALEGLCHQILRHGQAIEGRLLGVRRRKLSYTFPVVAETMFRDWTDVHSAVVHAYLRPVSKGLKAVDALQKPNNLFKVTVDSSHPINAAGLVEAVTALGSRETVYLFFALPNDCFQNFQKQTYVRTRPPKFETKAQSEARLKIEEMEDKVLARVVQVALLIDVGILSKNM